jgi:hypothetical protein
MSHAEDLVVPRDYAAFRQLKITMIQNKHCLLTRIPFAKKQNEKMRCISTIESNNDTKQALFAYEDPICEEAKREDATPTRSGRRPQAELKPQAHPRSYSLTMANPKKETRQPQVYPSMNHRVGTNPNAPLQQTKVVHQHQSGLKQPQGSLTQT